MSTALRTGVVAVSLLLLGSVVPVYAVQVDATVVAREIVRESGWPVDDAVAYPTRREGDSGGRPELRFQRVVLAEDIAHYELRVRVGPGSHDYIGLHRVVRERRPYRPIRTPDAIFLQHGDAKNFEGMFLPGTLSPSTPDEFGLAIFLAENDVDVWGIDQGWTLVPEETTDFSFMADWGLQRQIDDLRIGMGVARAVRWLTGNGFDPLLLLGYSSGGSTGYATLNHEAALPEWQRQVAGYVCADMSATSDDEFWREVGFCAYVPYYRDRFEAGEYQEFIPFALLANLARTDPDGDSPVFPGFTNLQAALYFGAGPIFGDDKVHYWAGVWEGGLPVDFQYVTIDQVFDFMAAGVPWEALLFMLDYSVLACGEEDSPFDDHFADIIVPIFNLGMRGGIGPYSEYTLTQVGSTDITSLIVSTNEDILLDFAHIDMFTAYNAPELVWEPLLDWVQDNSSAAHGSERRHNVLEPAGGTASVPELSVEPNPGGTGPYAFSFSVPNGGRATLEIFDVTGRRVAKPLDANLTRGTTQVMWEAKVSDGQRLAQGVYFARMTTSETAQTVKFVHLVR